MSLNSRERAATARELAANLALSGLTPEELRARPGLPAGRSESALQVDDALDPADVWHVRDTLEDAVVEAGATPVPYSRLSDDMRAAAGVWFGYRRGEG